MSSSPAILVINSTPNPEKQEQLQSYLSQIVPIIEGHGGKLILRTRTQSQIIGEEGPRLTANFEFPSEEAIRNMVEGEDFNALNDLRNEVYKRLDLMISAPF